MGKAAIDVAKALARLSASTIFELRGEWRRLHRASPPMRLSRDLLGSRISFRRGATAALPRPPHGSWNRLAPKRLVIANGAGTEVNAGLVELIKEAFAIRNQLLSGSDASIEAMSERLGIGKGRLTSLVRLSYLAPGIVRALLAGHQPFELTPTRLLRLSKNLPHDWKEQRRFLGLTA
jgi:hypothetical protein